MPDQVVSEDTEIRIIAMDLLWVSEEGLCKSGVGLEEAWAAGHEAAPASVKSVSSIKELPGEPTVTARGGGQSISSNVICLSSSMGCFVFLHFSLKGQLKSLEFSHHNRAIQMGM